MDFAPFEDVHELTMGMFRARVTKVLDAFDIYAPAEVVNVLAGLMNLAAHERVLDEAAIREVPDPEHPAVRNLRDQLVHTQAAVDMLSTLPVRQFEAMADELTSADRAVISNFLERISRASRAIMVYAGSTATNEAARMAYDEIIENLVGRIQHAAEDPSDSAAAVRSELFSLLGQAQASRAGLFRDSSFTPAPKFGCGKPGHECCQIEQPVWSVPITYQLND